MTKKDQLERLDKEIMSCQRCPLYRFAKNPVPGEGDVATKIVFVGEAPGFYEDEQGRPFVGRAGRLLSELLESISFKRENVFITNILKHRPPNNRDPQDLEIKACNYWLDKQLGIIKPKIIATLGRFSMAKFLPNFSITKVHGQLFKIGDFAIFPLFHPAAALRSTQIESLLREDFKKIPSLLYRDNQATNGNGNSGSSQLNLF